MKGSLLGVIVASLFICFALIIEYDHTLDDPTSVCDKVPSVRFDRVSALIPEIVEAINLAKKRVLVSADGTTVDNFLRALQGAESRGVLVSLIMDEGSSQTIDLKNITRGNIGCGYIVVDQQAYIFKGGFAAEDTMTVLTSISECETAVKDIVGFFNFQYLRLRGEVPKTVPISMQAKTSLIKPLRVDSNETLYFFHNPSSDGDLIRISTTDILPPSLYANANTEPQTNISVYSDDVPVPSIKVESNLFTVLKRILIKVSKDTRSTVNVRLLVPKKYMSTEKSRWINGTAAFNLADVRLYDSEWTGPNFIEVGGRVFLFSHTLNDGEYHNQLGFHMSTNSTKVVESVKQYWNQVWDTAEVYSLDK